MNIFENYNSAKQKYGLDVVNSLVKLGLPPQFLLSACRFNKEYAIPLSRLVSMFKEWTKYVVKYNNIDVNRISYEQFFDIIAKEKNAHCVPNILITTEYGTLGQLNNAKDVQKIPCNNQWCIKSQKWFDKYTSKGYVFFVIYLSQEPSPFTYVIAAIFNGNVEYYDSNDHEQYEDLRPGGDISNSDHEIYQRKIPKEIISYIYNIAANQTENIENQNNKQNINCGKIMNNTKKRIRLTETQLHQIIKEAINELHKSAYMGRTTPYHYHNKTAAQCLADKAREQENYNEYDTPDDPRNEIDDEEWAYDHPQCRPADKLKHQTVIPTFDGDSAHGRNPFSESIRRAIRQALR